MIRARHARLIRIGIYSRCLPYKTNKDPDPVFGGYFTTLDFSRLREYQYQWELNRTHPLVEAARNRTKRWISTRYV